MKLPIKFEIPEPPEDLSSESKELYRVYAGSKVDSPAKVALFVTGLRNMDISKKAADILASEGLTVTSKRSGMSRAHPCISIQKEATFMFLKICKALNLENNMVKSPNGFGFTENFEAIGD